MTMSVKTNPKTWESLLDRIRRDDKERVDFNVTWKDLTVLPNQGRIDPELTFVNAGGVDSRTMTERAYRQYLSKLGIQHRQATLFTGRLQGDMIQERLDYRNPETDEQLVDPDAKIFLRTRPGRIRAILSGRYGNMRDAAVAEIVNELLPELKGYDVLRGRAQDHVFSVTLLGQTPIFDDGGDRYFPIHVIRNSEVGASAFRVSSGVCKGACSNGMIFSHRVDCKTSIRHLGAGVAEKVVEALTKALGNVGRWKELVAPAIKAAQEIEIDLGDDKQKAKMVKRLRDRGLSKRLALRILDFAKVMPAEVYGSEFELKSENVISMWHVVNSATHLAQDEKVFGEIERQEIEEAAGRLLLV